MDARFEPPTAVRGYNFTYAVFALTSHGCIAVVGLVEMVGFWWACVNFLVKLR